MILNDGETFTDIEGCAIYEVPEDFDTVAIEDALWNDECKLIARFYNLPAESPNGWGIDPTEPFNLGSFA